MSFLNVSLCRSLSITACHHAQLNLSSKLGLRGLLLARRTPASFHTPRCASRRGISWIEPTDGFDALSKRFRAPTSTSWLPPPKLKRYERKTYLFFMITSMSMFTLAAYMTNRDTTYYLNEVQPEIWRAVDNEKLRKAKELDIVNIIRVSAEYHLQVLNSMFPDMSYKTKQILATICSYYHNPALFQSASPEWFIGWMVCAPWPSLVLGYFARCKPFMKRHMEHRIWGAYTLFTAMFNYRTVGQLACMLYGAPIAAVCGSAWFLHSEKLQSIHEATPIYHMAAFVCSAGMFSLLMSYHSRRIRYSIIYHLNNTFLRTPQLHRFPRHLNLTFAPNTGLSGAIYASITVYCCEWQNEKSRFTFGTGRGKDIVTFSSLWFAWVGVEAVLMVLGVGTVNWAAHLAGVVFGWGYQRFGIDGWVLLRGAVGTNQGKKKEVV